MSIEVRDAEVLGAFARLIALGENPRATLAIIGDNMAQETRLRFRDGHGPTGAAWAALSPVTIARRRGGGVGAKPLQNTGQMRDSITFAVGANYVEVGTNVIQARVQQMGAAKGAFGRTSRGAPIPWGNIPARPFLGFSAVDRSMALEVFREAIDDIRRAA